jgi:ADP-heptose:LPS heptosyltransferase
MDVESGEKPRRLIIFPGALGDLICLIPAIRVIAARHPESVIELMARFELARFAVGRIGIARAHSIDRAEVAQLFAEPPAQTTAAREFFGGFDRIYSFFAADDGRFRLSLGELSRDVRFYPFRPLGDGHVASAYLRSLDTAWNGPLEARIDLLPHDVEAATARLARSGLAPRSFLLILPGSGSHAKNWPVENFIGLAKRLEPWLRSLCLLGPAEMELSAGFRAAGIVTFEELELGEVAGIAAQARVFVGNDSGVSHLASASGARGVVLFGPTDADRWRPLGKVHTLQGESMAKLPIDSVEAAISQVGSPDV